MTLAAFLLIVTSIVMHSLWHFLSKSSGKPSFAFFSIFSFSLFCTLLPLALCSGYVGRIPWEVAKFAIAGGLCGALCDAGLIYAYKYSDISLAYPTARALPVFFTLLLTTVFHWGKSLSAVTFAGMLIIFAGCMMMAFSNDKNSMSAGEKVAFIRKALPGIMIAACSTTAYTVIDSFGINAMMKFAQGSNPLLAASAYSLTRELPATIILSLCAFIRFLCGRDRGAFTSLVKSYHSYLAGFSAAGAYLLILIAMSKVSNVSYVQSFRQLSLPFSAFLGWYFLKEKITPFRWAALATIMVGLFVAVI